jgi:hypothetical protein
MDVRQCIRVLFTLIPFIGHVRLQKGAMLHVHKLCSEL